MDNKEIIKKSMANMEFYPMLIEEQDLEEYHCLTSMPWEDLAAFGAGFGPVVSAFNKVMTEQPEFVGKLYEVVIPEGGHLAAAKKGDGLLGSVLSNKNNQLMGQARLHEVDMPPVNPLEINPAMIVMAAALMGIEHRLGEIEETQKEILKYLKNKEKAELRSALLTLSDILKNYKYNWDNEMYQNSNHIKVLDVKQKAEEGILFHRKNIKDQLEKKKVLQIDKDVHAKLQSIESEFEDYQLAVYLFGMASYLDVMLLENFNRDFIRGIVDQIEEYSYQYRELYTDVYEQLDSEADKTVQAALLGGLGKVAKVSGKAIAKVPGIKKGSLDEGLISAGDNIKQHKATRVEEKLERLVDMSNTNVSPFVDNLKLIDRMNNEPLRLVFNEDQLYIAG